MNKTVKIVVSHIGICTADIQRSERFYREALGFELVASIDNLGTPYDRLLELPGKELSVRQLTCGEIKIELIGIDDKEVLGSAQRRPINQRGFTHMTISSTNIDQTLRLINELGGQVHQETRVDTDYGPILFCTDPDGVRIEVMGSTT